MKILLLVFLCVCVCLGGAGESQAGVDWKKRWKRVAKGYKGCFVLFNVKKNQMEFVSDSKRCRRRWKPCSTFKIPNAAIALQTRIASSPKHLFKWDKKKRMFAVWNRDHRLKTAIRYSVVWVFQRIARRVGLPAMRRWLRLFSYGNQAPSSRVAHFWLDGSLRISPIEQVKFLRKLYTYQLPLRKQVQSQVVKMLILGKRNGVSLSGKTGSGFDRKRRRWTLGWFVGSVKTEKNHRVFAILLESGDNPRGGLARRMAKALFWKRARSARTK